MFRTLSFSLLLACSCDLVHAQQVDDGGVSGTLMSFSHLSAGPPASMFEVPGGTFALTTACLFGGPITELTADAFGVILIGPGCVTFSPGLAIMGGDQVRCANGRCVITGVLIEGGASAEEP
jgi:hypothetical protein